MVFPGLSLYNKESSTADIDRKQLSEGKVRNTGKDKICTKDCLEYFPEN